MTSPEILKTDSSNENWFLPWFSDVANTRGLQFEQVTKWWLLHDVTIKAQFGFLRILNWSEWDDRPHQDLGTDLVAWDRDDQLWAIQCKGYQAHVQVNQGDVAKLVASSPADLGFVGRLFVTSSETFTSQARKIAEKNKVIVITRGHLLESTTSWPSSESELRSSPKSQERKSPRNDQIEAIDSVVKGFEEHSRGQLIMACGTGKTLVSLWTKERVVSGQGKTLVLLPSINLVAQTLREWAKHRSTNWDAVVVCSDSSVTNREADDLSTFEAGLRITLDPGEIESFISESTGEIVVFATYQSSHLVAQATRAAGVSFDLTVCDEAHRLVGASRSGFACILDSDQLETKRRLFMTATRRLLTKRTRRSSGGESTQIISMDDESIFGPVFHLVSFKKAISDGLLTDFQVIVAATTDQRVEEMIAKREQLALDNRNFVAEDAAGMLSVLDASTRYGIRKSISFHATVDRARRYSESLSLVAREFHDSSKVRADFVSGKMPVAERSRKLRQLALSEDDLHVVSNARCLTEGVDIPALDAVIFVDPRKSQIDIVQAVGRAIRRSPGKKIGSIVVPIVCKSDSEFDTRLEDKGYERLRQVLWAMRAHDEELAEILDDVACGRTGPERLVGRIRVVIDSGLSFLSEDDVQVLAEGVRAQVIKIGSPESDWAAKYEAARTFFAEHGRWPSQVGDRDGERPLGIWVTSQRMQARSAEGQRPLSLRRWKILDETPGWIWDPLSSSWMSQFQALVDFRRGEQRWPSLSASDAKERYLARWSHQQRNRRRAHIESGKSDEAATTRFQLLEEIPGWQWSFHDAQKEEFLSDLSAFIEEHGRFPLARSSSPSESRLGKALQNRKSLLRRKLDSGPLEAGDQELFEALSTLPGWNLTIDRDQIWSQKFQEVRDFVKRTGALPRTGSHDQFESTIGKWLRKERQLGRQFLVSGKASRSSMNAERVALLETIPGWTWNPPEDSWEQQFSAAKAFVEENGRLPQRRGDEDQSLANWVRRWRRELNGSKEHRRSIGLTEDRAVRLKRLFEALPPEDPDKEWRDSLDEAIRYFDANAEWPRKSSTDPHVARLAGWINTQRNLGKTFVKSGGSSSVRGMTQSRYSILDSTPGWVWDARGVSWETSFSECRSFFDVNGRLPRIRSTDPKELKLARWLAEQRKQARLYVSSGASDGRMSEERLLKLESLLDPDNKEG